MSLLSKLLGIKSRDYRQMLDDGAVIIDVRTPHEYDLGHMQEAKNIPLDQLNKHLAKIQAWNKPVITLCKSGARSARAASILKSSGIEAYNGGAWQRFHQKISK